MKLTKSKLKEIIREEIQKLNEAYSEKIVLKKPLRLRMVGTLKAGTEIEVQIISGYPHVVHPKEKNILIQVRDLKKYI